LNAEIAAMNKSVEDLSDKSLMMALITELNAIRKVLERLKD